MPATVQKRANGLYRVVRSEDGKLIRSPSGKPIDGGGHEDKKKAVSQACKINVSFQIKDALTGNKPIDLSIDDFMNNKKNDIEGM